MRESRTYGSVRGACDETHVPTATPARIRQVPQRRGVARASIPAEILAYAVPNAAAQMRIVSKASIRLDSRKSVRSFKEIICVDISEFESSHPSRGLSN